MEERWFHPPDQHGRGLRSFCLTAAGLVVHDWGHGAQTIPWEDVLGVDRAADRAFVRTRRGTFDLGPDLAEWSVAAELVERARLSPPDRPGRGQRATTPRLVERRGLPVPRETICRWLAIDRAGELVCREPLGCRGCSTLLLVCCWLALVAVWDPDQLPIWNVLGAIPVVLVACVVPLHSLRADGDGLTGWRRGRRLSVAWAEVLSVREERGDVVFETERGRLRATRLSQHHRRLCEAAQRVLQARDAGMVLSNEGPLPAGALSRLSDGEPDAAVERGLSLVERDDA